MADIVETGRPLFRELEALEHERAVLDAKISAVKERIANLVSTPRTELPLPGTWKRPRTSPVQDKVVQFIAQNPDAGYAELVTAIYSLPVTKKKINAARTIICRMHGTRITGSPRTWRVVGII